jgi:Protein of unknown function (DUF2846)
MMRRLLAAKWNIQGLSEDSMISSRRNFVLMLTVVLGTALGMSASSLAAGSPQKALNNQDILEMHRSGLSADVIVAKIKVGPCDFDTSPAALQRLKSEKVPDNVILAMVNAPAGKSHGADSATKPSGDSSDAHLRVYRQRRGINSTFMPSIFVDDKQVLRIGNGTRCTIKLSPGSHSIRSDDKSSAISLDVKGGQEYFIRVDEVMGVPKSHGKLTMMSPEQGGPEYRLQKPLEEKHRLIKDMIEDEGASK